MVTKTVKCAICGREFETSRPNKKYCSFLCKETGRKLCRIKWEDANPHYITAYMKEYRERRRYDD